MIVDVFLIGDEVKFCFGVWFFVWLLLFVGVVVLMVLLFFVE